MRRPNSLVKRLRNWFSGTRARRGPAPKYRPCVEGLETRQLLSTFTVVLATDSGGPGGQMVTPTSGDLRYCIAQADATHAATSDIITFDPTLFATAQTITLNSGTGSLVLSDSNPLTIQGPAGRTATVSGGDAVEVLDIQSGTVKISNVAFSHGNTSGKGGGIFNSGTLSLTNCLFDHDTASVDGGGLYNTASAKLVGCTLSHDAAVDGGGILALGIITLSNCNLSNDSASGVGGGGIFLDTGCKATVTNCTFSNDTAMGQNGGAVSIRGTSLAPANATFTNCTLTNDSAGNGGGGLSTSSVCTVTMTKCNISNDTAGGGGGVCNSGSTVRLIQCTLSNDSSSGFLNEGTATLTNCTFSNNTCSNGGGMENLGPATVTNCTFSNNTAVTGSGGGIYNAAGATLNLINTIVAENTAASAPDVANLGTLTADHDLIGDGAGSGIANGGGNLVGGNGNPVIDPRLGPLQNNGGTTQTLALLADSPAIGQADNAQAPATDQRGHKRIDQAGEVTDIGAFEYP
jgi:hypothetical protein